MDKKAFAERFGQDGVPARDARELYGVLTDLRSDAGLEESERGLARCIKWVRKENRRVSVAQRARIFVDALHADEAFAVRFSATLCHVLTETRAADMLETGIPNERGIWEETADRLSRKLLPTPRDERDLGTVVSRTFSRTADPNWIEALPIETVTSLMQIVASRRETPWAHLHAALIDTTAVLATRTAALGLARDIRARSPEATVTESPFHHLPRCIDRLVASPGASTDECRTSISSCRTILDAVLTHLDRFGVSVDLVYRIEVMTKNLDRIEELLEFLEPDEDRRARGATSLLARIVRARIKDRSFRDLVGTNVHLLARKIIERVGHTGEHYITATRKEYAKMLVSAGGGGVLTSVTAALKYIIAGQHYPLFVEGFTSSINYSASFILMQFLGFTLATKQPSMTAAALAGALKDADGDEAIADLVTMVARTTRSQLAAAFGNIALVIPAAFSIDWLWFKTWHVHFLAGPGKAEHTIETLHALHPSTFLFACFTGVLLWLSSICAGWVENWAVYRRIPEGIEGHPVRRIIGRRTTAWIAKKFVNNLAGVGGSTALGFMLGMAPVFGVFLGLPIEVRHVTLSTGALTFAMCALGKAGFAHGFGWAALGIVFIFIGNLTVSFSLALTMAVRARGAENVGWRLTKAVLKTFLRHPFQFIFPPKTLTPLAIDRAQLQNGSHGQH